MKPEQLKEFQLKIEGFVDGMRFGANQTLQWIASEIAKDEAEKTNKEKNSQERSNGDN